MKKQNNMLIDLLISAVFGAGTAMIISLVICSLGASLIAAERVGENHGAIISVIALIVSSAIGAGVAFGKSGHHRLVSCLTSGAVYYIMLLGCNALLLDGLYQSMGITALAVLGGSGSSSLLGLRNNQHKSRCKKYHNTKLVQNRQTGN